MKKLIIALVIALSLFEAERLWATTSQAHSLGVVSISTATFTGGAGLWSRTAAQVRLLAPSVAGQIIYCSNCTAASVCVSTGTSAGAWITITTTTINSCL